MTALGAGAQQISDPQTNSPYSRFGLGDLAVPGYATQSAMGGVGQGYSSAHIPNPLNPASLGALRFATYQVGVNVSRDVLTAGNVENEGINGNLGYLSLAFTTRNTLNDLFDARTRRYRYATLLSVTPYSTQGYNIRTTGEQEGIGTVVNSFLGTGGYYRLRSSHALEIDKKLRLGITVSYLFGRTNTQTRVATPDIFNSSVLTDIESSRARGVEIGGGVQYDIVLENVDERPSRVLTLGGSMSYTGDLTGSGSRTVRRANFGGDDLISEAPDEQQRITMPLNYSAGLFYNHVNRFSAGADLSYATWGRFNNSLRPSDQLESGLRVSVGGEWIPDFQTTNKLHRIIRYRFGGYYQQDPRPGITADRALSFGLGIPIIRPREELSFVNLSINAGSFVTTGDIDQRYLRLTVGFALTDNSWFYKRRFK